MPNANTPDKMSAIHKHMAALTAAGLGTGEVASITGYSETAVSSIKGHPDFVRMVDCLSTDLARNITDDVAARIKAASAEALDVNLHLMRFATSERVRQISCFDILDRAGFKPREVHISASVELPKQDAALIHETLKQLGQEVPVRPPLDNAVSILTKRVEDAQGRIAEVQPAAKEETPLLEAYHEVKANADDIIEQINQKVQETAVRTGNAA